MKQQAVAEACTSLNAVRAQAGKIGEGVEALVEIGCSRIKHGEYDVAVGSRWLRQIMGVRAHASTPRRASRRAADAEGHLLSVGP